MIEINALGDVCPIPVVKAKNAIKELKGPGTVRVEVDNRTAVENLKRLAAGMGAQAAEEVTERGFAVAITVTGAARECACRDENTVVVIASAAMGEGSEELGRQLMKSFIYALSQMDILPRTVLFYNGGAALTCEGSPALEDLRYMAEQGVEIMTCGTCLSYYGLMDKLAVGQVGNMYAIVEKMSAAAKLLRP